MISGFRYGFLGIADVSIVVTLSVLMVFLIIFYALTWYVIEQGRGLRS
jgi:ABC-2 type transport system permease protein